MSIIQVENLVKNYKSYKRGHTFLETLKSIFIRKPVISEALKGISFSIEEGELVGFLGPNGAGKSTTLKILTGVIYPTAGDVSVLTYVPWRQRRKYVAHIGAVFGQKSQLIWDTPAIDAFHMNKAIYGIDDAVFSDALEQMIDLLEIEELVKKPVRQLSLGERMKCEFVMAMLHKPNIVFLDEPTIGLDVIAKDRIREFIKKMNEQGTTFILATHDLGDIEHLAKRVIIINHGEIVFDNNLAQLKRHLGDRKIVRVVTRKKFSLPGEIGISNVRYYSEFDAELELDLQHIDLNDFISYTNRESTIVDLTIQELPIEHIVKQLYQEKKG